ncbi:hypothetical protein B0180_08445 [Moraxella canis]|uniref:Uncharacterized protein n=1 Tax=Moraxella canis TaxID=90239 RepID=A0A1S9ZHT2_9GAMM|nr:hypothetical protein B0180_08445 [Moraxella canis]
MVHLTHRDIYYKICHFNSNDRSFVHSCTLIGIVYQKLLKIGKKFAHFDVLFVFDTKKCIEIVTIHIKMDKYDKNCSLLAAILDQF